MKLIPGALGLLTALALFLCPAAAGSAPVEQARWAAQKKTINLPNGQTLAYVEWGDPEGEPVLLLHGFTDTSRSWTQILPSLADFRVIIPDQRGHGASAKPQCCYAIADFAYDAKLLMDALEIERASVAGHSLGSMVAIDFAATYPERIDRLVMIASTALAPMTAGDWLSSGALAVRDEPDYETGFLAEWIGAASPGPDAPPVDETFLSFLLGETSETPAQVWRGVARELIGKPVARLAPYVKAPTLIMAGGADDLLPAEHQAALREALPQADYIEFDGLGHNLIWQKPEETGGALAEFLAR